MTDTLHEAVSIDLHEFDPHHRSAAATASDDDWQTHLEVALALYDGDPATGYEADWFEQPRAEFQRAAAIDRTRPDAWTAPAEAQTDPGGEPSTEKARRQQQLWTRPVRNKTSM